MNPPCDANVAAVHSHDKELIGHLLQVPPATASSSCDLAVDQLKDPDLCQLIQHMNNGPLPVDEDKARKVNHLATWHPLFCRLKEQ